MYVVRFSYTIKPVDRDHVLELLAQAVTAAQGQGLDARLLIPVTRAAGGAALVVEVVLPTLDQLEAYREHGLGSTDRTRAWLRELSDRLLEPPTVELLRIAGAQQANDGGR